MKKIYAVLNKDEISEIEKIYEKKVALENLTKIIDAENEKLYEKLIDDYTRVISDYNRWWDELSRKHTLSNITLGVDFLTGEVYADE